MKYDVDYFIEFYGNIPEDRWITGEYYDGQDRCCALGHLMLDADVRMKQDNLIWLTKTFGPNIITVNDGLDINYQQPTPKQRILALLHDIKQQS